MTTEPWPRKGPGDADERRRRSRRRFAGVAAASLAGHLAVLLAVLATPAAPPPLGPPAIQVELIPPPPPPAPPAPPQPVMAPEPAPAPPAKAPPAKAAAAKPAPAKSAPARIVARQTPARAAAETLDAGDSDDPGPDVQPTAAALAGARHAGGGGGGGGACDMATRLQAALRRDARVRATVAAADHAAGAAGTVIFVWNGDWIRRRDQDGNGLAAVREAIMWEVGFAPPQCRAEAVHGLVLISLNDSPGAARLALGSGDWRWSDLLGRR